MNDVYFVKEITKKKAGVASRRRKDKPLSFIIGRDGAQTNEGRKHGRGTPIKKFILVTLTLMRIEDLPQRRSW